MQGESLSGLMKPVMASTAVPDDRSAYAETDYPHRAFGWSSLRALRTGKYLYIRAPERELYNQVSDPEAAHNLAPGSKAVSDTVGAQLDDFRGKTSQSLIDLGKPDPEQLQKLQALGYVASASSGAKDSEMLTGADPKTKIQISNLLHDAMFDVEDARYEEAIPLLKKALAEQPELPVAIAPSEALLGSADAELSSVARWEARSESPAIGSVSPMAITWPDIGPDSPGAGSVSLMATTWLEARLGWLDAE